MAEVVGEIIEDDLEMSKEHDNSDPPSDDSKSQRRSYKQCLIREGKTGGKHPFYYVQKFRKEWLTIEEFKEWIEEVPNDVTKARCTWCQKVLNARLNDLKRHIKTKKHLSLADQLVAGFDYVRHSSSNKKSDDPNTVDCSRAQLFTILRDISAMEENYNGETESTEQVAYENTQCDTSDKSSDFKKFAQEQFEQNKLLHALINVQKEKLSADREKLDTEKQTLLVQREILNVLRTKLGTTTTT